MTDRLGVTARQEVYAVIASTGVLPIGGGELPVPEIPVRSGPFVLLAPETRRQMIAGDQGLTWIGIGSAVE